MLRSGLLGKSRSETLADSPALEDSLGERSMTVCCSGFTALSSTGQVLQYGQASQGQPYVDDSGGDAVEDFNE